MKDLLSIVVPIKGKTFPAISQKWISNYFLIIVDSGGNKELNEIADVYIEKNCKMWEARKIGYEKVLTPYILNLDADTLLDEEFIKEALELLKNGKCDALAIDYQNPQGHYAFGASLWKTEVLKKLYDYSIENLPNNRQRIGEIVTGTKNGFCECIYMWYKLKKANGKLETLPFRAIHLK